MLKLSLFKSGLVWLWLAALIILLDQYSKTWVLENLSLHEPLKMMPFFNLTLAYNTGAAFSFLHSMSGWQNLLLGGLAFFVAIAVIYWLANLPRSEILINISLALILGGALGNAWDRLQYGYVIDFLSFHIESWHFAIFNIADAAISIGAFLLILHWMIKK